MFRTLLFCLSAALTQGAVGPAMARSGDLISGTLPASTAAESRERQYSVYVPDGLPEDGSAPLVTVLHGCKMDHTDMAEQSGFMELADREKFAVLFPFVTSYDGTRSKNCWGFWFDHHQQEGAGEPGDLRRMIAEVETELNTDPDRRYIAGLSSGAAMSVVMAVSYSEDIAAAGSVAGVAFGEDALAVSLFCGQPALVNDIEEITSDMATAQPSPEERALVPMMVIHSINDCRVRIDNAQNLATSWITYYGAEPSPADSSDCSTEEMPCIRARFEDAAGNVVVETVFYEGPDIVHSHFWPGDGEGDFANPDGPGASAMLWDFFKEKRNTAP